MSDNLVIDERYVAIGGYVGGILAKAIGNSAYRTSACSIAGRPDAHLRLDHEE